MSTEDRPNPDALLAELSQTEESSSQIGKLRIFLGMCPGVGKTYAMLQAANQYKKQGIDVVIGVVETHGRAETAALLEGMEIIPLRPVEYRGVILKDMDLDAVLARHPQLVLVDELAHSNVPGSRHPKRYQDVFELLEAGICVDTTLNIQHIESRVEVVQQITGITVRETVPDSILDRADEIQLIDLSPEQVRQRLAEGKVYLGERAEKAAVHFFRHGNLTALRELALRYTAEGVDRQMRDFMQEGKISGPWKSSERLLVGIAPHPTSESLVRWTRRMAGIQDATWMAVFIDNSKTLSEEEKRVVTQNLSLARQLGAEVLIVPDANIVGALLRVAREHNVTQIVVGKPHEPRWLRLLRGGTLVDHLLLRSENIDLYIVRPDPSQPLKPLARFHQPTLHPQEFVWGTALLVGVTLLGLVLQEALGYRSISLFYLLSVVLAALFLSRWPALVVAAMGALLWDFFFVPPCFTFWIEEFHDGMMFAMLLIVGIAMGHLTSRLREREKSEHDRQVRSAALLRFTQLCALELDPKKGLKIALEQVDSLYQAKTVLYLRTKDHGLAPKPHPASSWAPSTKEQSVARWAFDHRQAAGRWTETLPESEGLYIPLQTQTSIMGIMGLHAEHLLTLELPERELLEAFALQIALALEKEHFREAFQRVELIEESDRLRQMLIEHLSHELKPPMDTILASLTSLKKHSDASVSARESLFAIHQASAELQRITHLLVECAEMESGIELKPAWCSISTLISSTMESFSDALEQRQVSVKIAEDLVVKLDQRLMSEALAHLLDNAMSHTPVTSPIEIEAKVIDSILKIRVADRGPGLVNPRRVFEKFYRGPEAKRSGLGLGLPIAQGLVQAQHGTIEARNRNEGGAEFIVSLPIEIKENSAL